MVYTPGYGIDHRDREHWVMARHEYLNEQGDLEGAIEYLPIQEWFMKKELKNRNHFNHSFLIRVTEKIDKQRLGRALEKLNKRHDMLRAQYRERKQSYRKESRIAEIREWDIKGKTAEATHKELTSWQNRFDIEQGYLWQSGIIRGYEDGSERVYFAVHHLVFDAASWPIIREDLKDLYEGKEIEKKGSSYRQWVEAVKGYGKTATDEEKRYWEEIRTGMEKQQNEWAKLAEDDGELRYTRVEFALAVIDKLLRVSREVYRCGIPDLLLSGLSSALCEVSGKKSNWITMETQGREGIDSRIDVSRTVGWFTTLYPLCLTVGKDIRETIIGTLERTRKVPHGGIGYGAIHGYDKLPRVLFNYLERIGGTTETSWQIRIREASGESMSPDNRYGNVVDINGLGIEGKIGLGVESCLKAENHALLCEAFRRNVEAIATSFPC